MKFDKTEIPGVVLVTTDVSADIRGTFSRIHSRAEFIDGGVDPDFEQCSLSYNHNRATVRGLHFQVGLHVEAKLVCCVAGSIFDVVVDLRQSSPTHGRAWWVTLAADRGTSIYVPKGCAHGFQTLEDGAALLYMISVPYQATAARGIRWDDPALRIPWPEHHSITISERDKALPLLSEIETSF